MVCVLESNSTELSKCPPPKDGVGTVPVPRNQTFSYPDIYIYSCQPGFKTEDNPATLCQPDGNWSTTNPPNCSGIDMSN